jgi:octaprenyl-diphosphate synthase
MQRGSVDDRSTIRQAIETGNVAMLDQVVSIVKATGALDIARMAAQQEALRAIAAATRLPKGPHTDCLIELASQLLERNH